MLRRPSQWIHGGTHMIATRLVCASTIASVLFLSALGRAQSLEPQQLPEITALPPTIPLFPLQDVMLFPNMSRPLHIFEGRYREMVIDALDADSLIGMVLLQPGYEAEYEGNPPIFSIGCVGLITEAEELPDGRWFIVLRGAMKFRVLSEDQSRAYRLAEVEEIPERLDSGDRVALSDRRQQLAEVFASMAPGGGIPPPSLADEDLVNGLAQFVEVDPIDRQGLLETEGPLARAEALLELVTTVR